MTCASPQITRVILIVLDGVGVGALPDAGLYGDVDANTLLHVAQSCGGLNLPHLQSLGLGNILNLPGVLPAYPPLAHFGRMEEVSTGKDSTTGHWEICGVVQGEPFATFPHGFPDELIRRFKELTGVEPLGNIVASGTEILKLLGEEHLRSGRPIIYTSVDSVLQIAAHEDVIPVEHLYEICRISREIADPYRIGRVIARPFTGQDRHSFKRTKNRHDFSMPPTAPTVLDHLRQHGFPVHAIGKINDLFAGQGISSSITTRNNRDGMAKTVAALSDVERGLIFTNLIDFDMEFGHRLDAAGFGGAMESFDSALRPLLERMLPTDLLIITADHGCDPTTAGTDHSREYVPLLLWSPTMTAGRDLGCRSSFSDVGATIAAIFALPFTSGQAIEL